jgi:UrcA family protein
LQHGRAAVCQGRGGLWPGHRHKIGFIGKPSAQNRGRFLSHRARARWDVFGAVRAAPEASQKPERQEIAMLRPATLIIGLLAAGMGAGWAGTAQSEPRMVYTRHALKVDLRGLDLSSDTGQRALQARLADAADQVCGGRPDRGNRYTQEELTRMLPAYDQCRAEAIRRATASLKAPMQVTAGK